MNGRCALITGASRGIGAEIARRLANEGYTLTLSARHEAGLIAAAKRLHAETGADVHAVTANMAVESDVRRLAAEHAARYGRLDLLVLNAGVGTSGSIGELPVKTYDLTLAVNVRAAFILLQETLPMLRKTAALAPERGAKIVALASIAGVSAEANLGAFAASKAALISLCQTVTLEESGNGVTATALCPGLVATDMTSWPVVASNVGGIPEVVADGETGLLVPPDEPDALAAALNTLARDPERAKAMGEAGRQRAISEFDWTSIALQTAKLYQEVAGSTVKPAHA